MQRKTPGFLSWIARNGAEIRSKEFRSARTGAALGRDLFADNTNVARAPGCDFLLVLLAQFLRIDAAGLIGLAK